MLDRVAMVDEIPDRQTRGERWYAAHMIGVIVGDDQIVDLRDARSLRHGGDPIGVPAIEARKARIDQNTLAGRGYEQGGLPSFHVDKISGQVWRRSQADERNRQAEQQGA